MRTIACTTLALVAFAANSVLCRMALGPGSVDAVTFSTIRLIAGAAVLLLIGGGRRDVASTAGAWISATILFLYAIPFALAYVSLSAGTGALILFGSVQTTMMVTAVWSGERPRVLQWLGLGLALGGLAFLVLPGLTAPPLSAAALMALAGVCWGAYTLRGRSGVNALTQNGNAFVRAVPMALVASLAALPGAHAELRGILLAVASGALASGLGYAVWYVALRGLSATRAAIVQLVVPIEAAAGGVIFLGETVSIRLIVSTVMVLGGVGLALIGRERRQNAL